MSDELRVGPRHWRQQLRRWATVGPPRAAQHNDAAKTCTNEGAGPVQTGSGGDSPHGDRLSST